MTPREAELHTAKVCLREARIRRMTGHHRMADRLLQWAANARRRAGAATVTAEMDLPAQGDLFGSAT